MWGLPTERHLTQAGISSPKPDLAPPALAILRAPEGGWDVGSEEAGRWGLDGTDHTRRSIFDTRDCVRRARGAACEDGARLCDTHGVDMGEARGAGALGHEAERAHALRRGAPHRR